MSPLSTMSVFLNHPDLNRHTEKQPRQCKLSTDFPYRKHLFLVLIFTAALLFDTISTMYFMQTEGIELEIHPLVRYSAFHYGPIFGTFLASFVYKLLAGLVVAAWLKQYAHYFLKAVICTASFAGLFNFWGHLLYL